MLLESLFQNLLEKDLRNIETDKSKCYCNQCKDTKDGEKEHAECLQRCKSKSYMFEICIVLVHSSEYFNHIFEGNILMKLSFI